MLLSTVSLTPTVCAICRTERNADEVYPQNLPGDAFSPAVFSARRLPDQVHYRIVRCTRCGLVRSDPVADNGVLDELYARSTFDYGSEVTNLTRTYGRALRSLEPLGVRKGDLLEIGCGNGFFLEEALNEGYTRVVGVEPSAEAIARAPSRVRDAIVCDVMRPGLFDERSFDVVCMFQVFDHLTDPAQVLDVCHSILRPGGLLLCLNHNVEAFSARVLRQRSPIVDVEHTYLYSPATLSRLVRDHGFTTLRVGPVLNTYSMWYLLRLVPLPSALKSWILNGPVSERARSTVVSLPIGNLCLVAARP
jgi:SAM-dependent methyltransferase